MVILKFGGTSVAEVESIRRVAGIIASERRPRAVVVSALAGVTDALLHLAAGGTIPGNPPPRALDTLLRRHTAAVQMVRDRGARVALEHELYAIAGHVAATLESAPGRLSLVRDSHADLVPCARGPTTYPAAEKAKGPSPGFE